MKSLFSFKTAQTEKKSWKEWGKTRLIIWWYDVTNKIFISYQVHIFQEGHKNVKKYPKFTIVTNNWDLETYRNKQDFFCSPTNQEKRLPKMSRPAAHNSYLISAKKNRRKKALPNCHVFIQVAQCNLN